MSDLSSDHLIDDYNTNILVARNEKEMEYIF